MRPPALRLAGRVRGRWRPILAAVLLTVGLLLLAETSALASDVYGNIAPAPQVSSGALAGRYPLSNYQLDQYFPGISVSLFGGVDVSGVPPLIAYFIAQVIWIITAFLANALITVFAFAFSLDLLNGNGTAGSGALTAVANAIHDLYTSTFGAPWLIAAIVLIGCWTMCKALIQRRYSETAGALALSLFYCVLAIGIVTQPQRTIAPASQLSNEISTSLLSLTSHGTIEGEARAKTQASNQLFQLLVLDPWTVLEFGGIEQCARIHNGKATSVAVRPLSSNPERDSQLSAELENATEVQAESKTCVNALNKYAPHFLAYPFQSHDRNAEHEALEHGDTADLPNSDPGKQNGSYRLSPADEPAAEAMGKGGQYQRLLLAVVIFAGELGAFLLLGALALGVILAQILLLLLLAFAPVALLVGIFPGRGHDFFRAWLSKLAGFLARKVIYSLILALILTVCGALAQATSSLGWLLAFALQAAFLWAVFLQRHRLTTDLLAATAGPHTSREPAGRLQALYYSTRLARMAGLARPGVSIPPLPGRSTRSKKDTASYQQDGASTEPRGADVPEPGDGLDEPIAGTEAPYPTSSDPDEEPA